MGRSPCCDKTKVKKGPWSVEEDRVLQDFIAKYGNGGNWITLPKKIGLNRCGKSCRLRWLNYLRPNIKRGDFSEEEDRIICTLYTMVGSRWSKIASELSGRTDNDVKNYWNSKLKKKISSGKFINLLSTNSSGITNSNYNNNNSILQYEPTNNNNNNNYSKSNIISSSMMSQGEVSSQFSRTTSSSNNDIIRSNNEQENEFWMDLFSESFDDVIVSSRLVEEKVTEIASLLDVFVD